MQDVLDFLNENRVVFIATSDNGAARVRPFQFQFEDKGRLWFFTGKSKQVYAQLQADPRLELSCMSSKGATLRLKGEANLEDNMDIKKRLIEANPKASAIFKTADNPNFAVFSVDHGTAFMFDFSGNPPKSFTF